jgi:hypothetical protein
MEISEYKSRTAPDRYKEVKINCEMCGVEKWVRWCRVQNGQGRFCSRECANKFQLSEGMKTRGKEFAHPWYDEKQGIMLALWKDLDGVSRNTTYAHWLWEHTYGSVPARHQVRWKDGNQKNCVIENIELVTPEMISSETSQRLMGHTLSEETRHKISIAHSGKTLSEEHKENIGSATSRMWRDGVFDNIEIREAYAKQGRATKGSKRTEKQKKKMSNFQKERFSDVEKKLAWIETVPRGENSGQWRGGVSDDPYPPEFSKPLREKIRQRDHNICRICHESAEGDLGRVHHIDANKYNNDEINLILLCKICHGKVHARYEIKDPVILAFRSQLHY